MLCHAFESQRGLNSIDFETEMIKLFCNCLPILPFIFFNLLVPMNLLQFKISLKFSMTFTYIYLYLLYYCSVLDCHLNWSLVLRSWQCLFFSAKYYQSEKVDIIPLTFLWWSQSSVLWSNIALYGRETNFPTIKPTIYLPKWLFWVYPPPPPRPLQKKNSLL